MVHEYRYSQRRTHEAQRSPTDPVGVVAASLVPLATLHTSLTLGAHHTARRIDGHPHRRWRGPVFRVRARNAILARNTGRVRSCAPSPSPAERARPHLVRAFLAEEEAAAARRWRTAAASRSSASAVADQSRQGSVTTCRRFASAACRRRGRAVLAAEEEGGQQHAEDFGVAAGNKVGDVVTPFICAPCTEDAPPLAPPAVAFSLVGSSAALRRRSPWAETS